MKIPTLVHENIFISFCMNFSQTSPSLKQHFFWLTGIGGVLLWYILWVLVYQQSPHTPLPGTGASHNVSEYSILSDSKAREVYALMKKYFFQFDQKTETELKDGFLSALVESLWDRHSAYFNEQDTKEFKESLAGDFEGVGAVIESVTRGIKIAKILEGSPAQRAGLMNGDVIVSVDGKSIVGWTTEEAVKIIRWPKGSEVILGYVRGTNDQGVQEVHVQRDVVNVPSVSWEMRDGDRGYIEIVTFWDHTTSEFEKAVGELVSSWATALVLDFRNNWWGYLDTAINLLSLFLPEHTPVMKMRKNDAKDNTVTYTNARSQKYLDIPLVLLVNGLSASASEIVAGALQDHHRAVIIGEITYGKGSVQEPFFLGDGSLVKLTIAKWYTPWDREIDAKGIEPDISISLLEEDYQEKNDRQLQGAETVLRVMQEEGVSVQEAIEQFQDTEF